MSRLLFLLVIFFSDSAFAVSPTVNPIYNIGGNLQSGSSPLSAYQSHVLARLTLYSCVPISVSGSGPWTGSRSCVVSGVTGTYTDSISVDTPAVCPVGSTLGPDQISCNSVVCPAAGTLYMQGKYIAYHGGHVLPLTHCVAGCEILTVSQRWHTDVVIQGSTTNFFNAMFNHTGVTCSPNTPDMPSNSSSEPVASCAPGQSSITMAGKTKCLNPSTGTATETRSASQVAEADSLAAQKAAAAASAVQAAATAAGAAAAAQGATASEVQAASTQAAAQTAAAQAAASGVSPTDPCAESTKIGCMDTGEIPGADAIGERTLDFSTFAFNTYTFAGTAACPAPRTLNLTRGSVPFSYQPFCDFLNVFKFAALALATYIASLIMMGQRSSD